MAAGFLAKNCNDNNRLKFRRISRDGVESETTGIVKSKKYSKPSR